MHTAFGAKGPLNLVFYALAHGLVELACASFVISRSPSSAFALVTWVLGYNFLAFGMRVFLGRWVDFLHRPGQACSFGLVLVAAGVLFVDSPLLAVVLLGLGNALFHIGGGSLVLSAAPRRAAWPGLFLAPGGLGISVGTLWGQSGYFPALDLAVTLIFCTALSFWIHSSSTPAPKPNEPVSYFGAVSEPELLLLALCGAVACGSFLSFALHFPWKGDVRLLASAMAASALGRGLGGIVADKLGFGITLGGALLGSAPCLILGQSDPRFALVGLFLLNLPGPLMLVAVTELLPGRPGLSFGLVSLALLLGLVISMAGLGVYLNPYTITLFLLFVGLPAITFRKRYEPSTSPGGSP